MLFNKLKNKFIIEHRIKKYISIILICFAILFTFYSINKKNSNSVLSMTRGEWIIVTTTNSKGKSDLWIIDTKTQDKTKLLHNRDVMTTGKINSKGNILIYSDAIGTSPWNIFKLNIKTKETHQITKDPLGEFNLHFGNEKGTLIFTKSGGKTSPIPQISKINTIKKESQTFNLGSKIGVQDFDVRKNKIIALIFSFDEFITKQLKQIDNPSKMKYSIVEMDFSGNINKKITTIDSLELDSISFSKSGNSIILGGKGIVKNETGFYKLNLKNNKINILLTEEELKQTNKISSLSQPYIPCLNYNEKKVYFTAIPAGVKPKNFVGITVYPNALYCYDLEEKKLNEFFKIKGTFIPAISFTYQKI